MCGFWPYLHAVLRFQVILFAVLRYQYIIFCDFIHLTYIHLWLCSTWVSLLMNNVFHAILMMPLMTYAQEPGTHSHNKWRVEVIITNVVLSSILIVWCLSLHPLIIAKLNDFRLLGMLFWKGSTVLVTRWASRMRRYWGLPVIWILHGTIIPNMPPWLTGCPVTLATQLAVWSIALLALKVAEKIKIFRKS